MFLQAQQHLVDLVGRVVGDEEIANLPDFEGFSPLHLAASQIGNSSDSFDQIQVLSVLATNSNTVCLLMTIYKNNYLNYKK